MSIRNNRRTYVDPECGIKAFTGLAGEVSIAVEKTVPVTAVRRGMNGNSRDVYEWGKATRRARIQIGCR